MAARPLLRRAAIPALLVLLLGLALSPHALHVRAQAAEPVFALPGTLIPTADGGALLDGSDGRRSALEPATDDVAQDLALLAERRAAVRVWGLRQGTNADGLPRILVNRVRPQTGAVATPTPPALGVPAAQPPGQTTRRVTPAATPVPPRPPIGPVLRPTDLPTIPIVPTPTRTPYPTLVSLAAVGQPTARINAFAAAIRLGPEETYAPIGSAREGELCLVLGRAPAPGWYYLQCPGATGWVREGLYTLEGPLERLPLLAPLTPTPTATATPDLIWSVAGFANPNLEGSPVITTSVAAVDFDWGLEAPFPGLPVDNVSLRFDSLLRFAPGRYTLALTYDDGVRLYLNNQLVHNDWNEAAARSQAFELDLGGDLAVRLEYFDAYGDAKVQLIITPVAPAVPPPPTPTVGPLGPATPLPPGFWQATYYNGVSPAGTPIFSRVEPADAPDPLNREYSIESPVPGVINADLWSARWRGRFPFAGGDYRFTARGNDGVRLYIDGVRVIDAWPNGKDTVSTVVRGIPAGERTIVVEAYDEGGLAWVRAAWAPVEQP